MNVYRVTIEQFKGSYHYTLLSMIQIAAVDAIEAIETTY